MTQTLTFHTIDYVLIAIPVLSSLLGLWRGLVQEAMSFVGWFVTIAIAYYFSDALSPYLSLTGADPSVRTALAFIILFIISLLIWGMLTAAVRKGIGAIGLNVADRILGSVFGLIRGGLIVMAITISVFLTPISRATFWQQSPIIAFSKDAMHFLKPYLPHAVASLIT